MDLDCGSNELNKSDVQGQGTSQSFGWVVGSLHYNSSLGHQGGRATGFALARIFEYR